MRGVFVSGSSNWQNSVSKIDHEILERIAAALLPGRYDRAAISIEFESVATFEPLQGAVNVALVILEVTPVNARWSDPACAYKAFKAMAPDCPLQLTSEPAERSGKAPELVRSIE